MSDYTELNETFQKFIDENNLGELFRYSGDKDYWEFIGGYPGQKFTVHNLGTSISGLIITAYRAGQINGRKDQLNRTMRRLRGLIEPSYNESIWI
jgi:hypothetical protein